MRSFLINLCRTALLLAAFWWILTWVNWVSDTLDALYPWKFMRPIRWTGLLLEVFIVQSLAALPLVYPLAWIYRGFAVPAAVLLAFPFLFWADLDWEVHGHGTYFSALLAYKIVCHVIFLVGGTWVARRHLIGQRRSVQPQIVTAA